MTWQEGNKVPETVMEILSKNQVSNDMIAIFPPNITDSSESKQANNFSNKRLVLDDVLINKDIESVSTDSVPTIQITEHVDENNYFLCEYLENGTSTSNLVDVAKEVGKLLQYCANSVDTSMFRVDQPKVTVYHFLCSYIRGGTVLKYKTLCTSVRWWCLQSFSKTFSTWVLKYKNLIRK